ncbi:MAG TPA: M28 family peptidase, partial [Vicinamibacteria bacterium]
MGFTTVYRRSVSLFCAAVAVDVVHAFGETASSPAIQQNKLIEDIRYLAADVLGGRGNGSSGLEDAASYIEKRFRALGLEPGGDGESFLQPFRVATGQELGGRTKAILRAGATVRRLEPGTDFEPLSLSPSGEVEGPVVFAGYGVTAPDREYDDYRALEVDGRIVLLLRYAPAVFGEHGWHATFLRKAKNAASHGAVAVLIVNGPRHHRDDRLVPFGADSSGYEAAPIPVVHLRRDHAEALMGESGRTLLEIQDDIDASLSPRAFALEGVSAALTVDVRRTSATVSNVLGFLPPTDPPSGSRRRSGEHIVIGAHYDHLGLGEKGTRDRMAKGLVHNGADDNASGVAGVLELARVFSLEAERPRGILFAAFAGEELGLKGSAHYTFHPSLPTENAVAMINLDM